MQAGPHSRRLPATEPVIVADNDAIIRDILRSVLTGVGQTVLTAVNGDEALALAWKTRARLIVLDLNMPGLNGLMACARIRAMRTHATTPIIILSGHHDEATRRAADRAGATLFIAKPFQAAALLQSLAGFLDLSPTTHTAVTHGALRAGKIATAPTRPGGPRRRPAAPQLATAPDLASLDATSLEVTRRLLG